MPEAIERNVGTRDSDANGEAASGSIMRAKVRKRSPGAEYPGVARKSPTTGWSQGGVFWSPHSMGQPATGGADEGGKAVL